MKSQVEENQIVPIKFRRGPPATLGEAVLQAANIAVWPSLAAAKPSGATSGKKATALESTMSDQVGDEALQEWSQSEIASSPIAIALQEFVWSHALIREFFGRMLGGRGRAVMPRADSRCSPSLRRHKTLLDRLD